MSALTPNTGAETVVHVAVGILTDGDKVFITRRSLDSHQGGKWEFPGGKLEPQEEVLSGLRRELHEELGVDVQQAHPFMQIHHAYPDKEVLLDVWRITVYGGIPHGREGQEARWVPRQDLPQLEFPEADKPVLRRLWLPPLYLISDVSRHGKTGFLIRLERALKAGARMVQLREPEMSPEEYRVYAKEVASLCHRHGAILLLNAPPEWVRDCDADGVHLNSRRLLELPLQPLDPRFWVAASCHNAGELNQARRLNMDFAVLSPVAKTRSHPDAAPLGWDNFQKLCRGVNLPVYALGGMGPRDMPQARAAGAQGLAMISRVWDSDSPETVIAEILSG
jgi:8-oxo-dGTP diphosphatase